MLKIAGYTKNLRDLTAAHEHKGTAYVMAPTTLSTADAEAGTARPAILMMTSPDLSPALAATEVDATSGTRTPGSYKASIMPIVFACMGRKQVVD